MKELPLGETTENELLGQPGATGWRSKIESATESVDLDVRAGSYRVGRIYSTDCIVDKMLILARRHGLVSIKLRCHYWVSRTTSKSCAPQMRIAKRFCDTVVKTSSRLSQPLSGRR